MNKRDAKIIALTITNEELAEMFDTAKRFITNWTEVSSVNKGMTKGTAWNILAYEFDVKVNYAEMAKVNMIREFGEYLPKHLKIPKPQKSPRDIKLVHQEPKFT